MRNVQVWGLGIVVALALTGCASSYQVVQMPQREADLYPLSQTRSGITVAIDQIDNPARVQRYFGADLIGAGILPITIVVSNRGAHRSLVKPSDIVLFKGREMLDPLPIEAVAEAAKRQHRLRSETEEQVDHYFRGVAFRETVLPPNDAYQGVMFFATPRPQKREGSVDRFFTVLSLFREGGPRMRVAVTDLESGDRLHFGPFSVALPQHGPASFTSFWY